MKALKYVLLAAMIMAAAGAAIAQPVFSHHFRDETMRIDYYHTGNSEEEIISLDQVWRSGIWSGSRVHLIDDLDLGRYYTKVYDAETEDLLYSKGFDSYYGEWKTTGPAASGVRRTYHESSLIPYPRRPVEFVLEVRQKDMTLKEIYRVTIDPHWYMIREDSLDDDVIVMKAAYHGDPHGRVDIAILGDGYTADQEDKFRADVLRFSDLMLSYEPYNSMKDKFNIWGVLKPSQESGCDEPSRGVHRNTSLGSTFDSLGSERYLLTEDNRVIRDIAANVPYDVLYIMVNHERYGGGGIYNLFCTFTSDNQWSPFVFLHEFGHSFAGLADEYYSSSTAYNDFYPAGMEPHERNITALLDPDNLKWKELIEGASLLPTPWRKSEYDAMDAEYNRGRTEQNKRIAELMNNGVGDDEIATAIAAGEDWSRSHQQQVDEWFKRSEFFGQVGAFEGAGYVSQGMYRSQLDCIMFTKGLKTFCAACNAGIREVTERYTE